MDVVFKKSCSWLKLVLIYIFCRMAKIIDLLVTWIRFAGILKRLSLLEITEWILIEYIICTRVGGINYQAIIVIG